MSSLIERLYYSIIVYKITVISFIAVIAGIIFVILASPADNLISTLREDVIRHIGIAFIVVGFASLFYENFLRKNMVELIEQIFNKNLVKLINDQCELVKSINKSVKTSGLVNVYTPGKGGSEILNFAIKNVKMLGITINTYFTPVHGPEYKQLQYLVEQGCKLQILMLNPNSQLVKFREIDEKNKNLKGKIQASFEEKKEFIEEIEEKYRSNVEIRFYDTYPIYAMIIIDDSRIRLAPYLYNRKGQDCPAFEYVRTDGGPFDAYLEHFNNLWKSGTPAVII